MEKSAHKLELLKRIKELEEKELWHQDVEDDPETLPIIKAADKLSAYIKCIEEQKTGNTEFDSAARQTLESIHAMNRPELKWFLTECLPAFTLNLDELN